MYEKIIRYYHFEEYKYLQKIYIELNVILYQELQTC